MMRRCKPIMVGDLWSKFISENPQVSQKLCEAQVPELWPRVVGSAMASLTQSVVMKNGILHVAVTSSVARQELFMRRDKLRDSLNAEMGRTIVKSIIIR